MSDFCKVIIYINDILLKIVNVMLLRSEIFNPDYEFAWKILDAECQVHIKRDITIHDITTLS